MRALLTVLCMAASAAPAQDLVFSPAPVEECLGGRTDMDARRACIGKSARQCMERSPGGDTTVGMGRCLSREADYWDGRLNRLYGEMMREARAADGENAEYGIAAPSQAAALRDMQRAWRPFRDAKCGYAMSLWGTGTGGGPAYAACVMTTTATQVLFLQSTRSGS